jgi:hypothetical protein
MKFIFFLVRLPIGLVVIAGASVFYLVLLVLILAYDAAGLLGRIFILPFLWCFVLPIHFLDAAIANDAKVFTSAIRRDVEQWWEDILTQIIGLKPLFDAPRGFKFLRSATDWIRFGDSPNPELTSHKAPLLRQD